MPAPSVEEQGPGERRGLLDAHRAEERGIDGGDDHPSKELHEHSRFDVVAQDSVVLAAFEERLDGSDNVPVGFVRGVSPAKRGVFVEENYVAIADREHRAAESLERFREGGGIEPSVGQPRAHLGESFIRKGLHERLARREVAIQGGAADACGSGDVVHAGVAALGQKVGGCVENGRRGAQASARGLHSETEITTCETVMSLIQYCLT